MSGITTLDGETVDIGTSQADYYCRRCWEEVK